jgi:UDP-N-acetylmuramoylalanine--D-glutamate ligase
MNETYTRRVEIRDGKLFADNKEICKLAETRLSAPHNQENLQAAMELCLRMTACDPRKLAEAVCSFSPGRHRIETVAEINGITYVDDSKGTNPAAVVAALNSFPEKSAPYIILLLGGLDKGMDFSPLAGFEKVVKHVIFYGECADKICSVLGGSYPHTLCGMDFTEVMAEAKRHAAAGDTVLLSPACASMDMFKNYEERGNRFKEAAF